jgi:hypothetical protein
MANPTTNYSFAMPTNTDLVKDLPADFEIFGQAVDTQMKTNADAAIAKTIVDAKGDIIAATAADTVSRLAVGANDTVLTADSSTATGLKWATASSGGMTLLDTMSLSGSSTTSATFSSSYKSLIIYMKSVYGGDNVQFNMRLNADTGSNYAWSWQESGSFATSISTTSYRIGNMLTGNTAKLHSYQIINLMRPSDTDAVYITCFAGNGAGSYNQYITTGVYDSSAAITSVTFFPSSSTMTAGTVYIYGVN